MSADALIGSIRRLYATPISDTDAKDAAGNLLGFMELLVEIDREHKAAAGNEGQPCG